MIDDKGTCSLIENVSVVMGEICRRSGRVGRLGREGCMVGVEEASGAAIVSAMALDIAVESMASVLDTRPVIADAAVTDPLYIMMKSTATRNMTPRCVIAL